MQLEEIRQELTRMASRVQEMIRSYDDEQTAKQVMASLFSGHQKLEKMAAHLGCLPKPQHTKVEDVPATDREDDYLYSCVNKNRYSTAARALLVASERGVPLRVYGCPICEGFHLTKNTDTVSRHGTTPSL